MMDPNAAAPEREPGSVSEWRNWPVVLGAMLGSSVGAGPILVVSFGVFLKPVSQAFGWDRSVLASGLLVAVLLNAAATPVLGWLIDRFGVRRVSLVMITLFSLATAAMALMTASYIWLMVLFAAWGLTSSGQSQVPYATAMSTTFTKNRGLALGLGLCGLGLGTSLVPPIARWLLDEFGWRMAYVGMGALCFVVAFTAVFFLFRKLQKVSASGPHQAAPRSNRAVLATAMRSRNFWLILIPVFIISMASNGAISNLVPMLTDGGMTPARAAAWTSLVGVSTIVGKISSGFLVDRFRAQLIAALYFSLPLLGFALLLTDLASAYPAVVMISLGLALGSEVALAGTLVARCFGLAHFGLLFGCMAFIFSVGVGLGSVVMNASFDRVGTYHPALAIFAFGLVVAALLVACVHSDKPTLLDRAEPRLS